MTWILACSQKMYIRIVLHSGSMHAFWPIFQMAIYEIAQAFTMPRTKKLLHLGILVNKKTASLILHVILLYHWILYKDKFFF